MGCAHRYFLVKFRRTKLTELHISITFYLSQSCLRTTHSILFAAENQEYLRQILNWPSNIAGLLTAGFLLLLSEKTFDAVNFLAIKSYKMYLNHFLL